MKPISDRLCSPRISLFVLLFIGFAVAVLGDSVAESLLLAHFSAEIIPGMFVVNALFLFFSSGLLLPIIDRVNRGLFFLAFVLANGILVLFIWGFVRPGMEFLYVPLFSYAYVAKILLFLFFWTLANDLVDSRHAGKVFPFVAAGGTLGAIIVSFCVPFLLKMVPASKLLLVWGSLSLLMGLIFFPIYRVHRRSFMPSNDSGKHSGKRGLRTVLGDLGILKDEPLLKNMSILYALLFFLLLNQQFLFYDALESKMDSAAEIASFLGFFNGISMGLTFLLQITLAGFVLKRFGSTRAMLLLPVAFGLVFCFSFYLWATAQGDGTLLFRTIALGVGIRIAFFDSFFSPNFQVFFSSLPQHIRGRGKLSIEGVVKPAAMLLASAWLMLIVQRLSFGTNMVVYIIVSGAMIAQTVRLRGKYTESLSRFLRGYGTRGAPGERTIAGITGADSESSLAFLLKRESDDVKQYIIEILAELNTEKSVRILREYQMEAKGIARSYCISALSRLRRSELEPFFVDLLKDSDARVLAGSIEALSFLQGEDITDAVDKFIDYPNNRVQANTIVALWEKYRTRGFGNKLVLKLKEMLDSDRPRECSSALYVMTRIDDPEQCIPLLERFVDEREILIRNEHSLWKQLGRALAAQASDGCTKRILRFSGNVSEKKEHDISSFLAHAVDSGFSAEKLMKFLHNNDSVLHNTIIRGIFMTRRNMSDELISKLSRFAEQEYGTLSIHLKEMRVIRESSRGPASALLSDAVAEQCIARRLSTLAYVAALIDSSGKVRGVIPRLQHDNPHVRARALEVLDNCGTSKINRRIIEIYDDIRVFGAPDYSGENEVKDDRVIPVIRKNLENPNVWVRECAEFALVAMAADQGVVLE